MEKKPKNIFVRGPIEAFFIADSIQKHSTKTDIGAHSIFLEQVPGDVVDGETVVAIEYSSSEEMALKQMHIIREAIFEKYQLTCMHIYQSIGTIKAGEISLFVFTSSRQHTDALHACEEVVERIKKELPVAGKQILDTGFNNDK